MKLDGKVKGGLAWAGLVVVLAVPAANLVIGNQTNNTANAVNAVNTVDAASADTSVAKPALKLPAAKPAATDPIQTASAAGDDPVDKLLAKGNKLPSYISDGDNASTTTPAATFKPVIPAGPAPTAKSPAEVAVVAPADTPIPLPRSARPKTTAVASLPAAEKPLIIDEKKLPPQKTAVEPFPMSDDNVVTGDQLEEWDSGSLADYLERKGLMSETSSQADDGYDQDGFFLDEGPDRKRPRPVDDFFLF